MTLTITYTGANTPEIGWLFYKNPNRPQVFELNYGRAYVFYPEVTDNRTTIALLLDIDPIDLARGKAGSGGGGGLFDYVNDRPYVSSSFLSTAISRVFGTAISGRADDYQALADSELPLSATIRMLPCGGDFTAINRLFEPLGYEVSFETYPADEKFPDWGTSRYVDLAISGRVRLRDLLKHIYVLIPVFDRRKHYWFGKDEVDKLLRFASEWLPNHPAKEYITGRYLNRSKPLVNLALERLKEAETVDEETETADEDTEPSETIRAEKEKRLNLNTRRIGSVVAALKSNGVRSVVDLGCGEGRLLGALMKERQFERIAGMDVSPVALGKAERALKLDQIPDSARARIKLFQGSLTYKDARLDGFDAACVIEVIEHIDQDRIPAFERVLFEFARPKMIILTTPNAEYNKLYENLRDTEVRHGDHRFEWTRAEFREWAVGVAERLGYSVSFSGIGDSDETLGEPTQMGVFTLCE